MLAQPSTWQGFHDSTHQGDDLGVAHSPFWTEDSILKQGGTIVRLVREEANVVEWDLTAGHDTEKDEEEKQKLHVYLYSQRI